VSFNLFIEVMLPIVLLVAAGGLWPLLRRGPAAGVLRAALSQLVLYLFAPALMFSVAARAAITPELMAVPLLYAVGVLVVGALLYVLLYRSPLGAGLAAGTRATLLLAGMFGNVFFLGYPVLTTLYGIEGGRYAAFVDMLAATPLVWTLGVWIAVRLGRDGGSKGGESFWRTLLGLPPVWAFVLGVAANRTGTDVGLLVRVAGWIGAPTIPVMLFVTGLSIPWRELRPGRALLAVAAAKLVLMPLLVWLAAWATLGRASEAAHAALIEAGVPTMLMATVLADRFRLDTRTAGLMIGWSTVLYWVTLPVWLWIAG
jgi:hypothetical protein